MRLKLNRYKPDLKEVTSDLRTVGKVLIASFFAIVIWPGDDKHVFIGWLFLVPGVVLYLVGLHKVEDS